MYSLSRVPGIWIVIIVGLAAGAALRILVGPSQDESTRLYRSTALPSGPEVVLLYFGSGACQFSNSESNLEFVREAIELIRSRTEMLGFGFVAHGVAHDRDLNMGFGHLSRIGSWDEISLGRSWANTQVLAHLFSDPSGIAGTPRIVLLLRTLRIEFGPDSVVTGYSPHDEEILLRTNGSREIERWVTDGAPIPGWPALRPDRRG